MSQLNASTMAISHTRRYLAYVAVALYLMNITLTRVLRRVSQESQEKSDVPVHARIDTSKTCGVGVRVCVRVCGLCQCQQTYVECELHSSHSLQPNENRVVTCVHETTQRHRWCSLLQKSELCAWAREDTTCKLTVSLSKRCGEAASPRSCVRLNFLECRPIAP
jgi:hypothetical protein